MSESDDPPSSRDVHPSGERLEPEGCPNFRQEDVQTLSTMGIPEAMAKRALIMTGGQSLEGAAAWYFDNMDDEGGVPDDLSQFAWLGAQADALKMVFVVNSDLRMGKGKIASQVAHSCLGLYRSLLQDQAQYGEDLLKWETVGETKVVLSGTNTEHLLELQRRAVASSLPCQLIQDAGRTQIPSGSSTVLSIFGKVSLVDQITGSLSLL